jgi:hypothetical protein
MIMLTDDELTTMITHRYADAAMPVPLDAVQRRGARRRRSSRIASAAAIVVTILLIGGAAAWLTSAPASTTAAQRKVGSDCDHQYQTRSASAPQRYEMPSILPNPVIDMHSGAADFRLYLAVYHSNGQPVEVVFDCGHSGAGAVSAHLSLLPQSAYADFVLQTPGAHYYRDYLPDGSSALVGWLNPDPATVRVTSADGRAVPTTVSHGYFVAWSPPADLQGATVRVYDASGTLTQMLTAPTSLSGTYDQQAFLALCQANFEWPSNGGPGYAGDSHPVVEASDVIGDRAIDAVAVYLGNVAAVCELGVGVSVQTYVLPAFRPTYGWLNFSGGPGLGRVVGIVPPNTIKVDILAPDGTVTEADSVVRGVFAAKITDTVFENSGTRLVTTSPTGQHTYTNLMAPLK